MERHLCMQTSCVRFKPWNSDEELHRDSSQRTATLLFLLKVSSYFCSLSQSTDGTSSNDNSLVYVSEIPNEICRELWDKNTASEFVWYQRHAEPETTVVSYRNSGVTGEAEVWVLEKVHINCDLSALLKEIIKYWTHGILCTCGFGIIKDSYFM